MKWQKLSTFMKPTNEISFVSLFTSTTEDRYHFKVTVLHNYYIQYSVFTKARLSSNDKKMGTKFLFIYRKNKPRNSIERELCILIDWNRLCSLLQTTLRCDIWYVNSNGRELNLWFYCPSIARSEGFCICKEWACHVLPRSILAQKLSDWCPMAMAGYRHAVLSRLLIGRE